MRRYAHKITWYLFFDYFSSQETGVQPLYLSGRALRNIGANSFVLGIGKNVSIQNLRQVVQNTQDVFLVQTFEGLASVRPQLAYEVIQRTVGKSLYASNIDSSYILSHILFNKFFETFTLYEETAAHNRKFSLFSHV